MSPPTRSASRSKASRPQHDSSEQRPRREISVYDAVAGRCNTHGMTSEDLAQPARPEEVLFRRRDAPDYLYAENRGDGKKDLYWANEDLAPGLELPDSDLLKALHTYAADFYDRAVVRGHGVDERSMDGTALMALGILLEEAVKDCLGEKGHLVFVEGAEEDEGDEEDEEGENEKGEGDVEGRSTGLREEATIGAAASDAEPSENRRKKRRRLDRAG